MRSPKPKTTACRPNTRWFNREIREAKRTKNTEKFETGDTSTTLCGSQEQNSQIDSERKEDNILNNKPNSKKPYKVVNGFLKPLNGSQCLPSTQNTEALTEKFACCFTEKMSKIREELDIIETVTPSVN